MRQSGNPGVDAVEGKYYYLLQGNTETLMATTVTVKGQVTLPKAAREAAGIRPGDRVVVRLRPEGGLIVERETLEPDSQAVAENIKRINRAIAGLRLSTIDRRMSSDEWMKLLRGDD